MTLTGQYSRKLFRGLSVGHVFMLMLTYITFWLLNLLACSWVWLADVQGKENSWMQSVGQSYAASLYIITAGYSHSPHGRGRGRQWEGGLGSMLLHSSSVCMSMSCTRFT